MRILTEPKNALTKQYAALLATEGVELDFTDDAVDEIARIAVRGQPRAPRTSARGGSHAHGAAARRGLLRGARTWTACSVTVDGAYVRRALQDIVQDQDLSRYVL